MSSTALSTTPYADAADAYRAAGWIGVLPLPPGRKFPPPAGFTGPAGVDPDEARMAEWVATRSDGNVALRLPASVIGIDVDAYRDGAATLAEHEARLGTLPATVMTTSRTDGSGIRLYRVPAGLQWPGNVGDADGGIEIIQTGHRYAVVAPSTHPEGHGHYRWVTTDGAETDIPSSDSLPDLPAAWVRDLTGGVAAQDRPRVGRTDVDAFLAGLPGGDAGPGVQEALRDFEAALDSSSGRHAAMLAAVEALTVAGAGGAPGVPEALGLARATYETVVEPSRRPGPEFDRALAGSVARIRSGEVTVYTPADLLRFEVDGFQTPAPPPAATYNATSTDDAHLGARIAHEHLRGRWCWSAGLGWLRWDGRRWEHASEAAAQEAVRRALIDAHGRDTAAAGARLEARQAKAREMLTDTEELRREMDAAAKEHGDRLRAVRSYFTLGKIKAVLSIAKGVLIEDADTFDAKPFLLNVGNGVVDLRTGTLAPHRPELRFTKLTETAYRPGTVHDDWEATLQAMPADVRDWMRLRFGQAATGYPPDDDVVPFLYGGGANGKSTLLVGILKALGDFAVVIPEKVLLTNPGDHPTELMTLHGRRVTLLEELPQGRHLDSKRLKSIAGTDKITARLIGRDNISWTPTHALFVTTNYELRVDENDHGTWRRLARVPFPYRYGDGPGDLPKDATLRHRVRGGHGGQHEAALAWIVSGSVDWHAGGEVLPKAPPSVEESTREWRGTADVLGRFLEEAVQLDADFAVRSQEFYDVFRAWCSAYGLKPWGDQLLWERLKSHDVSISGGVTKPAGPARLGDRCFSTVSGLAAPTATARLLYGLHFTEEAKGYAIGAPLNR